MMKNTLFRKAKIRWFPVLLGVIALAWVMPGNAAAQKGGSPDLSTAIIRVAKDNIPAVVHIEVTRSQEARRPTMPPEGDPFFRFFRTRSARPESSSGSCGGSARG
jgi:serine protease Do